MSPTSEDLAPQGPPGIGRVDIVALSHANEIGGLPALVADFHPRELWTGATPDSPGWRTLRQQAVESGVKVAPWDLPRSLPSGAP